MGVTGLRLSGAHAVGAPSLDLRAITPRRTGRHDIFGTANFFNYFPFAASLELILELGVQEIASHIDELVVRLLEGIDRAAYHLVSSEATRTSLVVLEPRSEPSAEVFARLIAGGVHVAHRRGRIRISPHLYNTLDEIDQTLQLLHNSATRGS
jgi:cysteine desulfurase / selenocysteine lyase